MASNGGIITVSAESEFAFYSRYPDIGEAAWPKEAYDLRCPNCGADEIKIIGEHCPRASKWMLGDTARCWVCKHEFKITENCWKWRKV